MNMSRIIRTVLRECNVELLENLNSIELIEHLWQKGNITDRDRSVIKSAPTRFEQNGALLDCLIQKDDDALYTMIEFFRADRTQMYLLRMLEAKIEQNSRPTENNSVAKLSHESLTKIRNTILTHTEPIRTWGQIKDSLISRAIDLYEIGKERDRPTAIMMTLTMWCNQSVGTFEELIKILKTHEQCNALRAELERRKDEILAV